MNRNWIIVCSCLTFLLLCVCCLFGMGTAGALFFLVERRATASIPTPMVVRPAPTEKDARQPSVTPRVARTLSPKATPTAVSALETAADQATQPQGELTPQAAETSTAPLFVSTETLFTLENALVPINDLLELAMRLEGKKGLLPTVDPAPQYAIGDRKTFWVSNVDSNQHFQVDTVLRYETDHTYFWIEEGVDYDATDLSNLAETFENEIYPTNREFFGSEWTPGVDGDPHLYIVYAGGLGDWLAGYFSSADEYPPAAHEYSNAHETFMFNADNMNLGSQETYGTLAHEFQHMIHWHRDRNESTWMNEGFAVLAELLNDYSVYFDYEYIDDPDLQLTDWSPDSGSNGPHYGASFLFLAYFLNRFGEETTQRLIGEPENGMVSVDKVLADMESTDLQTGLPIRAQDVFLDWVIANYVQDGSVADGRYTYDNYPGAPQADDTEVFDSCAVENETRSVNQFGVDYIRFACGDFLQSSDYLLHFEGSVQVNVIPPDAHSGSYYFWSNKGDESDMTLTREFDFTGQQGPLTLDYWTWYDLEKDYDYAYLLASLDGETWQILNTPSCTTDDPSGNSYGCGFNGTSGGRQQSRWIEESVDLSDYAGKKVWLRFEYITDAAVNGEGLVLDDIAIPEIDYRADFETDAGGWEAAGFVRIQNVLPQVFRLALIKQGTETRVEYLTLSPDLSADIPLSFDSDTSNITLVVSAVTPFTRIPAAYRFSIQQP